MILDDIRLQAEKGHRNKVKELIRQALDQECEPDEIISEALIPAANFFGDKDTTEDSDIFRILSITRCVQDGLDILKPYLGDEDSYHIGTAIIGTVEGDLHDIGKNILSMMLNFNGIDVIDLGVNVSKTEFIKAIKDHPEARIVCFSSLLSTLLPEMKKSVTAVKKHDKKKKLLVMVGGSCVTEDFANQIGADVYTTNAVDCARIARRYLLQMNQKDGN